MLKTLNPNLGKEEELDTETKPVIESNLKMTDKQEHSEMNGELKNNEKLQN